MRHCKADGIPRSTHAVRPRQRLAAARQTARVKGERVGAGRQRTFKVGAGADAQEVRARRGFKPCH